MVDRLRVSGDPVITEDDATGEVTGDYDAINTERVNNTRYASAFDGADGGEQIQNAIADLPAGGGAVVVGPEGPDDVSASSGSVSDGREASAWELSASLSIPSNVSLVLIDCYLFLADGVDNNVIINDSAKTGDSTRDANVSVEGVGNAVIDGNGGNQTFDRGSDRYREVGILFNKVDKPTLQGFELRDATAWHIVLENTSEAHVTDVEVKGQDRLNQDGIHLIGPSTGGRITDCRWETGDDALVINATDNPEQGYGGGGSVFGAVFRTHEIQSDRGAIRTAPSDAGAYNLGDITFGDITVTECLSVARFGGDDAALSARHMGVLIEGLQLTSAPSRAVVELFTNVQNIILDGLTYGGGQSFALFHLNGFVLKESTLTNLSVACDPVGAGAIVGVSGGSVTDSTFSDITLNMRDNAVRGVRIDSDGTCERCTFRDFNITNSTSNGVEVASGASINDIAFEQFTFGNVATEWSLGQTVGVQRHGVGEAALGGGTPNASNWRLGVTVEDTDNTGTTHTLLPSGNWG